ncbi:hypothetical protein [Paenibacillus thermotolerans]|nr:MULTISPECIES: hypothetical protein [unclassified Paenibacillus]
MAKWKTTPPVRKPDKKNESNKKALQYTAIAVGALIVILAVLVVFTNN